MKQVVRQTRTHIGDLLARHGLRPRHDLGQNFLIDLNLLDFLVAQAEIGSSDLILEIGSGTGSLTAALAAQAGAVISVEVDAHMQRLTAEAVEGFSNVTLLGGDVLKNKNHFSAEVLDALDWGLSRREGEAPAELNLGESDSAEKEKKTAQQELRPPEIAPSPPAPLPRGERGEEEEIQATSCRANGDDPETLPLLSPRGSGAGGEGDPVLAPNCATASGSTRRQLKLVANLPYCVATPVISNLVASDYPWERMVVTIQYELAQRMVAKESTADYSALSVWLQSQCRLEVLKRLPPDVFWPRPKVASAMIRIDPDPAQRSKITNREFLHQFLRGVFQQRRKVLRNVLIGMYRRELDRTQIDDVLQTQQFNDDARAEQLSPAQLVDLSNEFSKLVGTAADGTLPVAEDS